MPARQIVPARADSSRKAQSAASIVCTMEETVEVLDDAIVNVARLLTKGRTSDYQRRKAAKALNAMSRARDNSRSAIAHVQALQTGGQA